MGLRQKKWARNKIVELKFFLGYVCQKCGSDDKLEFDCIIPQGDKHHKMEWSHRISFYRKQYRENNLQLLCAKCHIKKTSIELDNPF